MTSTTRLGALLAAIDQVRVMRPSASDPLAGVLLASLQDADPASTGSVSGGTIAYTPAAATPNACTSYMNVVVAAGAKTKIRLLADTAAGSAASGLILILQTVAR